MAAQPYFSEDLVAAILVRVPGESLIRFKCVSNQWALLISGKDFIKFHLKTTTSTKSSHMDFFFYNRDSRANTLRTLRVEDSFDYFTECDCLIPIKPESPLQNPYFIRGIAHCDGMLCIFRDDELSEHTVNDDSRRDMIVWNPLTKEYKTFTQPKLDDDFHWQAFGFGYDSKTDDYKAIYITGYYDSILRETATALHQPKIHSLGLKTGAWDVAQNDIQNMIEIHGRCWNNVGKVVNGCLYWLAALQSIDEKIVYFDLEKDVMREEESPPKGVLSRGYNVLGNLEGSLCLQTGFVPSVSYGDVWVMKEDDRFGTKVWSKVLSFRNLEIYYPSKAECFTPSGNLITLVSDCIYVYNQKYELVQRVRINDEDTQIYDWTDMVLYVESLVSPNA